MSLVTDQQAFVIAGEIAKRLSVQTQFQLVQGKAEVAGVTYPALRPLVGFSGETAFSIALSRTPFEVRAGFIADRFAGRMVRRFSETISKDQAIWKSLVNNATSQGVTISLRIDDQPCSVDELPAGSWRSLEIEAVRRVPRRLQGNPFSDWELVAGEVLCFVLSGLGLDVDPIGAEVMPREEGRVVAAVGSKYERNPVNRLLCIRHHGMSCWVCDLVFEETYGDLGLDFIEVHHVIPVSTRGFGMVDPVTELVPLCSNCHSMVHRRNPPVHPVDLRAQLGRPPKPSELVGSTGPKSEI